jgi:hypothetical protein
MAGRLASDLFRASLFLSVVLRGASPRVAALLDLAPIACSAMTLISKRVQFVTPEVTVEKTVPDPSKRMKRNNTQAQAKVDAPKKVVEASPQPSFNTQSLWPLGVIACGGALYGAQKIDPGMEDLFENAVKVREAAHVVWHKSAAICQVSSPTICSYKPVIVGMKS